MTLSKILLKAFATSTSKTTYSRCMSKVIQISCTMTNEEINGLKKCQKVEDTIVLFTNRYKTSPIATSQMPLEGLAKIRS